MSRNLPAVLERLLRARDDAAFHAAWSEFLDEYSRLILHGARSLGGSHDAVMDRYAYVLECLRRDDFRKFREYVPNGRGKFSTWLLVVVRRLCLDETRRRYGRPRGEPTETDRVRRRLADLVAADVDPELLPGPGSNPEDVFRASELNGNLGAAIAQLDPADRLLLRMRFYDEVSVAEIATICSFPSVFHVYRRLNGLYDELRTCLQDAGVRDAIP